MLEQVIISIQIIIIDIVMAADNAIVIGMVASGFAKENRKKIIAWGVAGAFLFRIPFVYFATYLLEFAILKIIGGILLLWIVNNLRQDFFQPKKVKTPSLKSQENVSFSTGVTRVLIADMTLSLDNVLGVVGAAKDHYTLMWIGLLLSILLVVTLASYFADYIKAHKWLGYVGLFVAMQLIIGGLENLEVMTINEKFKFLFTI
jgi:YjbE family integral membrane protein